MTSPDVNTIRRSGSRFYVSPETGEKVPGVTSVLNMLPKPFLRYWAAKVVAETAVRDVVALQNLVEHDPEGAIDYLKRAPNRNTRAAADTGTLAHEFFERMARGEEITEALLVAEEKTDALLFVQHYQDFLDTKQPEFHFVEETVWSDTHHYAGSFDAFATIDGDKFWIDNKTTRSGVYPEVGLQLAAYAGADNILRGDGTRVPMPLSTDGTGLVIHVRPEGWQMIPIQAGEPQFMVFRHLRKVFDFDIDGKKGVVGKALAGNRVGKGSKMVTPRPRVAPATSGGTK